MNLMKSILALVLLVVSSATGFSQSKVFANENNVAVSGYDVVAYFNQHEAVRGDNGNAVHVDGTTYYFCSDENAKAFRADPKAYQPQFGGYCAFAVAMKGAKAPTNPRTFKIRDGKLYLFFNDFYEGKPFNTIVAWNGNEAEMLDKANANWSGMK